MSLDSSMNPSPKYRSDDAISTKWASTTLIDLQNK